MLFFRPIRTRGVKTKCSIVCILNSYVAKNKNRSCFFYQFIRDTVTDQYYPVHKIKLFWFLNGVRDVHIGRRQRCSLWLLDRDIRWFYCFYCSKMYTFEKCMKVFVWWHTFLSASICRNRVNIKRYLEMLSADTLIFQGSNLAHFGQVLWII